MQVKYGRRAWWYRKKIVVVTELMGLNGRDKIKDYKFDSLIKYPGK